MRTLCELVGTLNVWVSINTPIHQNCKSRNINRLLELFDQMFKLLDAYTGNGIHGPQCNNSETVADWSSSLIKFTSSSSVISPNISVNSSSILFIHLPPVSKSEVEKPWSSPPGEKKMNNLRTRELQKHGTVRNERRECKDEREDQTKHMECVGVYCSGVTVTNTTIVHTPRKKWQKKNWRILIWRILSTVTSFNNRIRWNSLNHSFARKNWRGKLHNECLRRTTIENVSQNDYPNTKLSFDPGTLRVNVLRKYVQHVITVALERGPVEKKTTFTTIWKVYLSVSWSSFSRTFDYQDFSIIHRSILCHTTSRVQTLITRLTWCVFSSSFSGTLVTLE